MGNKLKRQNRMMRVSGGAPSIPAGPVQFGRNQLAIRNEDGLLINTTQLATPTQIYDADVAWVDKKHSTVSLFFAKFRYPERETPLFLSRLEIRYSFEAFRDHFWRNSRTFHAALAKTFDVPLRSRGAHKVPASSVEAEKSHSLWANFELLSQTGGEGCIDFYHVNPRTMAIFAQTKDESVVKIDAAARILLASVDLLGLLNDCTELAAALGVKEDADDAG